MGHHSSVATLSVIYCGLLSFGGSLAHERRASPASILPIRPWGLLDIDCQDRRGLRESGATMPLVQLHVLRGGAIEEDSDSDVYDSDYDDEYDDDADETSEEDEQDDDSSALQTTTSTSEAEFVDPVYLSPMMGMYSTVAVMMLSRRIDLFNPTVVKIARFAFIAYTVVLQLFLVYVRVRAKVTNDRTPVQISNPLSGLLSQQTEGAGAGMMKSLASSFLSSQSTVLEYDLGQARSMQSGILFNLAFMWFLHFKMQQVQPLILTTINGVMNLLYSPLFQVYVLGRNLQRPFKSQQAAMGEKMKTETDNEQSEPDEEESTSSTAELSANTEEDESSVSFDQPDESESEEASSDDEEIDTPDDSEKSEESEDEVDEEEKEDSIA